MIIYNYDKNTGELIKQSEARLDPLELKNGNKVYLFPANSTTTAPPSTGERQAAVFVNNEWTIVPDWRGVVYYIEHKTKIIKKLGDELPAGATTDPPPEGLKKPYFNGYNWIEKAEPEPEPEPSQLAQALNKMANATDFDDLMIILKKLTQDNA